MFGHCSRHVSWYCHYVWIADRYILSPHTASHSKYEIEISLLLMAILTKVKEEIIKEKTLWGNTKFNFERKLSKKYVTLLFETLRNLRLISNFQNPNIHTQNKNLKARPTFFQYSSGFHCRPRQNLFWLLYFFASKFH